MDINTITDAKTFVSNSGVSEWEWGDGASPEGFARWIRAHRDEIDESSYGPELAAYLASVGQDPADYGIECAEWDADS